MPDPDQASPPIPAYGEGAEQEAMDKAAAGQKPPPAQTDAEAAPPSAGTTGEDIAQNRDTARLRQEGQPPADTPSNHAHPTMGQMHPAGTAERGGPGGPFKGRG